MDAWSSGMATVQIASWCIVEDVFCRPDRMRLSFHYMITWLHVYSLTYYRRFLSISLYCIHHINLVSIESHKAGVEFSFGPKYLFIHSPTEGKKKLPYITIIIIIMSGYAIWWLGPTLYCSPIRFVDSCLMHLIKTRSFMTFDSRSPKRYTYSFHCCEEICLCKLWLCAMVAGIASNLASYSRVIWGVYRCAQCHTRGEEIDRKMGLRITKQGSFCRFLLPKKWTLVHSSAKVKPDKSTWLWLVCLGLNMGQSQSFTLST